MAETATLDSALATTANTAPAPSATPAQTTAPASPAAPVARPTSMADAFARTPPDAPETLAETPSAEAPVEPVAAPPVVEPPTVDPIAEARTAAATETEARLKQQLETELAPLRPVMPLAHAIAQDVQTGSVEGLRRLMQEYGAHPVLGQKIRSMLGAMLGKRAPNGQPQRPPAPEPEPQPDLQFSDGTPTYSPERLRQLLAWQAKQSQAEVDKKYQPLLALHQRVQRADQLNQMAQRATNASTTAFETWRQQPHFQENVTAIAAEQEQLFNQGITDPAVSLGRAYTTVLIRDVLPKLTQQQQTELVASATAKSLGRTDNPAAAAPSPPSRPKSMKEAFKQHGLGT